MQSWPKLSLFPRVAVETKRTPPSKKRKSMKDVILRIFLRGLVGPS